MLRSMQSEALPPKIPWGFLQDSSLLPLYFSSVFVALRSLLILTMPRLRHRMRSRRGSSRGLPSSDHSNPSSVTSSMSSGLGTSHYPWTRSERGRTQEFRQNWSSQAPPPLASSVPTTGSARFIFNSSLTRPRITAILSVVFLEESLYGESSLQHVVPIVDTAQFSNINLERGRDSLQPPSIPASSVPDEDMVPAEPGPSVSEEALAHDMLASGWCRIVEVPPDD